ncbi:hypothetical protein F4680DRAFT_429787 [Xylaria scruposa]|nr:hypothetical protein F4680DRAFT_429787 [Xylaria scruposa]
MSIASNNSAASSKRRKRNQKKSRRSRADGLNNGDAFDGISISAGQHEGSRNCVAYGSTDQDGQSVTTTTSIPIRSVTPINDIPEMTNASESLFQLDGCGSPFFDISDECFAPKSSDHMIQSHVPLAPQTDIDMDFVWNPLQSERLRIVKSEAGAMETTTAMNLDQSTSGPFPQMDFNFGHSSISSSPDTAPDFNLGVETDSTFSVARSPFGNWSIPIFPSVFTGPIITDQVDADPQQTGFSTDSGQDVIIDSNENNSSEMAMLFDSSFCGQFQEQEPTAELLAEIYSCPVECSVSLSEFLPSAQANNPGKGPRKRSSPGGDECDGGEDINPTNCGRQPRDNGGEGLLACPFYKKDHQRYQDCGKYTLRRIKDVKQHIYRLHCKPELYCSRCFESFKCSNERDNHIREGGCILQEVPNHDGVISDNQRKELKECKNRGTSKQQQWMKLWNVIFPGVKRPRSPYIESGQAELLSSLRTYWDGNADEIIAKSIGKHDPGFQGSGRIREAINIILDHFETDLSNWDLTADGENDCVSQPSPVEDILSHLIILD